MPPRRARRSNLRKRKGGARKRVARRKLNRPGGGLPRDNYALIKETSNRGVIQANQSYINDFNIRSFPRAMSLTGSFRFYRLKKVVFTYVPTYNTFQDGVGASSVPHMVWAMNRVGDSYVAGYNQLLQQGSIPQKFVNQKTISYKPNLTQTLQVTQAIGSTASLYNMGVTPVYNKWINTQTNPFKQVNPDPNPDGQQHLITLNYPTYYGHDVFFQQDFTDSAPDVAHFTVTCYWEFKDPIWDNVSDTPAVLPAPVLPTGNITDAVCRCATGTTG